MIRYMFSGPGGRIEFGACPEDARKIFTALLGHWSGDNVMFGRIDGPKCQTEADSPDSYIHLQGVVS